MKKIAVTLPFTKYQRLTELEDRVLGEKALKALESGFASEDEMNEWLKRKL